VAGVARYEGCPVPDRDGDGVNDEDDKCPDVPGDKANNGCPVIKDEVVKKLAYAAKNFFYNTGKYTLLAKSYGPLDEVVAILQNDKALQLDIDGYTDNLGVVAGNQLLSRQRADAVRKYLVSKGVDPSRLTAAGHGADSPLAPNTTAAGRAKNRRVELHVKY
jgi:outer membrane protein OmpA-like peptidoglycan-associated protein